MDEKIELAIGIMALICILYGIASFCLIAWAIFDPSLSLTVHDMTVGSFVGVALIAILTGLKA